MKINFVHKNDEKKFDTLAPGEVFMGLNEGIFIKLQFTPVVKSGGDTRNAVCLTNGSLWTFNRDSNVEVFSKCDLIIE